MCRPAHRGDTKGGDAEAPDPNHPFELMEHFLLRILRGPRWTPPAALARWRMTSRAVTTWSFQIAIGRRSMSACMGVGGHARAHYPIGPSDNATGLSHGTSRFLYRSSA